MLGAFAGDVIGSVYEVMQGKTTGAALFRSGALHGRDRVDGIARTGPARRWRLNSSLPPVRPHFLPIRATEVAFTAV